jgi:hypothetical protein
VFSKDLRAMGSAYIVATGFNPLEDMHLKNNECRRHDTYLLSGLRIALFYMGRTYGSSTCLCFNFQRIKIRCYNMERGLCLFYLDLSNTPDFSAINIEVMADLYFYSMLFLY